MKNIAVLFFYLVLLPLCAANLIPGDTSAETERATAGNGNFGAMIYGAGSSRLAWDRSAGFDGKSSLKAMTPDVYSLKNSLKLRKGVKYTFSFYAKSEPSRVFGSDLMKYARAFINSTCHRTGDQIAPTAVNQASPTNPDGPAGLL